MFQIQLNIVSCDIEYAAALGRTLANRYPIFRVEVMDAEVLVSNQAFIQAEKIPYDIILFDGVLGDQINEIKMDSLNDLPYYIGLCEEYLPAAEEDYIYKYAGVSSIAATLQILYAKISGKNRLSHSNLLTNIIGITSAAGGVGKSSIAITLARELSSYHNCKVLYLSLEELESNNVYIHSDGGRSTLSDYLYYLFSQREKHVATYNEAFLLTDEYGVDAFRASKGINELKGCSQEKLSYFLETLCSHSHYNYICLDFDADSSPQSSYLMKNCNQLLIIDDGKPLSLYKNHRLMDYLNSYYGEEFKEQMLRVWNKWTGEVEKIPTPEIFVIDYDSESFRYMQGYIEININSSFGLGVKKLAKEIREKV